MSQNSQVFFWKKTIFSDKFCYSVNAMKELFVIDLHDYDQTYKTFRRPSARGIIIKDNKIALVFSKKEKYYKFPGGGIHDNEDIISALIREVKEETGLIVIPDSVRDFGKAVRRQKSNKEKNTVFEQVNYYYFCNVEDQVLSQKLDDYEKTAEFTLKLVDIDDAIRTNEKYHSDDLFDDIMIQRETKVLKLIRNYIK